MKLLLVDDDAAEREMLKDILRAQGAWSITEAASGREAFEILVTGLEPAVCFFDVRMPDIDGQKLLSLVRREQALRHLKVIITSATRDREVILALGKLGISGYLLKPYEMHRTTASLTQLLGAAKVTVPALAARNLLARTALVADDDALTRKVLAEIIRAEPDWEVVEAEDGLAALELMRGGLRPDLAVLDLRMPRLDGQSLLQRIREDPHLRRMPVVIISGQQDREQVRLLAQLRISGYVLKPLDMLKARAAIDQALHGPVTT